MKYALLRCTAALALLLTFTGCSDDRDDSASAAAASTSTASASSTDTPTTGTPTTTTDPTAGSSDGGEQLPDGASCVEDAECMSGNCYLVPFLGGTCGACNEDADCMGGGCSPPNPFMTTPSFCNMGEAGGGCESDAVCMPGLQCGNVLDILGLIQINSCGECTTDADCMQGMICAPQVSVADFAGVNTCILPGDLPQDAYCLLDGNGNQACMSGICSSVALMDIAQLGACGECMSDADCNGGTCMPGQFLFDQGTITGSKCV